MSLGIVDTVAVNTNMQDNKVAEQVEVVLGSDRGKDLRLAAKVGFKAFSKLDLNAVFIDFPNRKAIM